MNTVPAIQVTDLPQVGRKLRKPTHPFHVAFLPWQIQPMLLAPVLPGDTMKNLLLQARAVTDPIKNPLIGWWHEYMFFYVKLRDLDERAQIEQMLLTNSAPPAAEAAAGLDYYGGRGVNWVKKCLDVVVRHYFRDHEETAGDDVNPNLFGRPLAKVNHSDWAENLKIGSDAPVVEGQPLPADHWPEIPPHLAAAGFGPAYDQWKQMQQVGMAAPTFEDYLKTFGVRAPAAIREEKHVPELLRYVREWSYPANTPDASGNLASVVSWGIAERADKDRFFAEPGFIFGVTLARPKVYKKEQKGFMGAFLNDAWSWLPALLAKDPFTSLKKFTPTTGPLDSINEDYWVDLADLFMNGDQFSNVLANLPNAVNMPSKAGNAGQPALGADVMLNNSYPTVDNIFGLFKETGALAFPNSKHCIRVDGRVDLNILSRVQDTTP